MKFKVVFARNIFAITILTRLQRKILYYHGESQISLVFFSSSGLGYYYRTSPIPAFCIYRTKERPTSNILIIASQRSRKPLYNIIHTIVFYTCFISYGLALLSLGQSPSRR